MQPPVQLTIRFTTGPGPAETTPPAPPAVLWASASATRDLAPACQRALDAMECVDTGPRFHLIFTTDAMPLLWIIESSAGDAAAAPSFELWPGSCGLPEVFVDEGATRACNRRYRLHALTEAGLRAMTPSLCPGDLVKMPLPPSPVMPDAGVDPGVQPPPDQSGTDGGAPSTGGGGTGGGPGPRGTDPAVHETESRSGCAFGGGGAGGGQAIVLLLLLALVRRRWSPR